MPARLDRFVDNVFFHAVEARDYPLFDSPYTLALASKMVEVSTWEKLDVHRPLRLLSTLPPAYLARRILGAVAPRLVTTLHGTDSTLTAADPVFTGEASIVHLDVITALSRTFGR